MLYIPVTKSIDLKGDKLCSDGDQKSIGDNGQLRDDSENVKPRANVLGTLCNRSTEHGGELVGIQSNLNPVVEESK